MKKDSKILSTHHKQHLTYDETWKKMDGNLVGELYPVDNQYVLYFNSGLETLEEFKTLWSTLNPKIAYELETPEEIQITDEALLKQLEELINIETYHGTTHITTESTENNLLPRLKLTYKQSSKIVNKKQNEALETRVTAIENLLSTTETSATLLNNLEKDLESEVE